jgi:hypothetical protein
MAIVTVTGTDVVDTTGSGALVVKMSPVASMSVPIRRAAQEARRIGAAGWLEVGTGRIMTSPGRTTLPLWPLHKVVLSESIRDHRRAVNVSQATAACS